MASYLERVLARQDYSQELIRQTLHEYLDKTSIYNLRAVSPSLKLYAEQQSESMFRTLYVTFPLREDDNTHSLETVAPHCRHLVILVERPMVDAESKKTKRKKRLQLQGLKIRSIFSQKYKQRARDHAAIPPEVMPAPLHPEARDMDRLLWDYLLRNFSDITALTLHVKGDPAWPGRTEIEASLITLRVVIERTQFRHLRTLTLSPIHAAGILHLRWSGFGAFYEVPDPLTGAQVWQSITALSLTLHNPAAQPSVTPAQNTMFLKILHNYLQSFSPTLRNLRFIWIDAAGPSPLLLDQTQNLRHIQWSSLQQFWFGNIDLPHQTIQLIPDRAPNVTVVKALRSTQVSHIEDSAGLVVDDDPSAWIDVVLGRDNIRVGHRKFVASSIYSQRTVGTSILGAADDDGVSTTSGYLPVMLDVRGNGRERRSQYLPRSVYVPPRANWTRLTDYQGRPLRKS